MLPNCTVGSHHVTCILQSPRGSKQPGSVEQCALLSASSVALMVCSDHIVTFDYWHAHPAVD